ncbi:putative DNA helicase [Legionella pneumophila]|uniref:AAA domain-containing protein n=1 Tax=Legionella pneumophila TaxID=446 RepID=UPI000770A09C|nr:AAA domain-containing protein [Legionella pneumophila]CZJ92425.1 putative DNA helicase [Legionella pneumophila]CZJ95796.1 putative DNA helicase [Legionella pneumophila]CZK41124.1 putative DNA helicase [Legionella pneumophila]CZK44123.1 putative DNA helicase [Legionella pneumophila]CZK59619.1 putative DNA helicase [Legionella pneumophila]
MFLWGLKEIPTLQDEEVSEINLLAQELIGRTFIEKLGETCKIAWSDILFDTPYNYQVNTIRQALGDQARVGSVDKFQGQEASIVFLSMCTSDANESLIGIDLMLFFLKIPSVSLF